MALIQPDRRLTSQYSSAYGSEQSISKDMSDRNAIHANILINEKRHKEMMKENIERQRRKNEQILKDIRSKEEQRIESLKSLKEEKRKTYLKYMKGAEIEETKSQVPHQTRSRTIAPSQQTFGGNSNHRQTVDKDVSQISRHIQQSRIDENEDPNRLRNFAARHSERPKFKPPRSINEEQERCNQRTIELELQEMLKNESGTDFFGGQNTSKNDQRHKKPLPVPSKTSLAPNSIKRLETNGQLENSISEFLEYELKAINQKAIEDRANTHFHKESLKPMPKTEATSKLTEKRDFMIKKRSGEEMVQRARRGTMLPPVPQPVQPTPQNNQEFQSLEQMEEKLMNSIAKIDDEFVRKAVQMPNPSHVPQTTNRGHSEWKRMRSEQEVMQSIENLNSQLHPQQMTPAFHPRIQSQTQTSLQDQSYNPPAKNLVNPVWSMPETISLTNASISAAADRLPIPDKSRPSGGYAGKHISRQQLLQRRDPTPSSVQPKKTLLQNTDKTNPVMYNPELMKGLYND